MGDGSGLIRVEASAELAADGGRAAIDQVRRLIADDPDLAALIDDHASGAALFVDMHVVADARRSDGTTHRAECSNSGVVIERAAVPAVEKQVSELSAKDHAALISQLRGQGLAVEDDLLARSFAHVTLGPQLLAELER